MYTVQFSIRTDGLELFSSQDSRDFRNFSLKEKLKEEKYEEAKETMVEVWREPDKGTPIVPWMPITGTRELSMKEP